MKRIRPSPNKPTTPWIKQAAFAARAKKKAHKLAVWRKKINGPYTKKAVTLSS